MQITISAFRAGAWTFFFTQYEWQCFNSYVCLNVLSHFIHWTNLFSNIYFIDVFLCVFFLIYFHYDMQVESVWCGPFCGFWLCSRHRPPIQEFRPKNGKRSKMPSDQPHRRRSPATCRGWLFWVHHVCGPLSSLTDARCSDISPLSINCQRIWNISCISISNL